MPLLKWDASLAAAAHQHALRMAQQNTLSHQLPGEPDLSARAGQAGARFSAIAENVAEGPNAQGIHEQWMNSPPHRANLLDPELTSVGIAMVKGEGVFFAVEDFSNATGQLSLQEQENLVVSQLRMRGIRILSDTSNARKTCLLDNGYAGNQRALLRSALRDSPPADASGHAGTKNTDPKISFRRGGCVPVGSERRANRLPNRCDAL